MSNRLKNPNVPGNNWLMLVQQLPSRPAYHRVKIWRLLQEAGAISLKNSVYVLPASNEAHAALTNILRQVERCHGDGLLYKAELVSGMRDDQLRALFNAAREADYRKIADELRRLGQEWKKRKTPTGDPVQALARVSQRLAALNRIDFFGASGRTAAQALLAKMEHSRISRAAPLPEPSRPLDLKNKTWVTRQDIHVDRIACAWLISRFIDPKGKLKFVAGKTYQPLAGEYRYDMQDGEFTHEGEDCSFEVLLRRSGITDPNLATIAEIVHDIDLEDGKFGHPQASGIAHVISGICRTQGSDEARVERGRELFDGIYAQFRRKEK